ncbi:MAG: diguanylate cyclase [Deinococcales bacterium]
MTQGNMQDYRKVNLTATPPPPRWSQGYVGSFFYIALLALYIPLLALVVYILFNPWQARESVVILIALVATLISTWLLFWSFKRFVAPLLLSARALQSYFESGRVPALPAKTSGNTRKLLSNVISAIQELDESRQVLRKYSEVDYVTGLMNRRAAEYMLIKDMKATKLSDPSSLVLVMLHFEGLEQLPSDQAEIFLKEASQILSTQLRGGDWVASWSESRFLVVLLTNKPTIVIERITTSLQSTVEVYPSIRLYHSYSTHQEDDNLERFIYRLEESISAKLDLY